MDAFEGRAFRSAIVNPFIFVIPRGFSPEESAVSFQRDDFPQPCPDTKRFMKIA
jgi:hypothetical protein